MRNIYFLLLTLPLLSLKGSNTYPYRNIDENDILTVTYDKNDDLISWEKSDRRIAFVSSHSGTSNIYYLDLLTTQIHKTGKGFYTTEFLEKMSDKGKVYVALTQGKDTSFTQPIWHNDGRKLLAIGTYNSNNEVFICDRLSYLVRGTGVKNIVCAGWKSSTQLLIVKKEEPKTLYLHDISTKQSTKLMDVSYDILGINRKSDQTYLACDGAVIEIKNKNYETETFKLPVNGASADRLKDLHFLVRNKNGEAQVIDLNNNAVHSLIPGGSDKAPTLSNNGRFVAFYSTFLEGIIIKKLPREFLF